MNKIMKKIYIAALMLLVIALPAAGSDGYLVLQKQISGLLNTTALNSRGTGVKIVSLKNSETIYSKNANFPLIPASNMKIITSSAALTLLKPEYTFKTCIFTDTPVNDGVISGNIYIKGYGDPDLTTERLFTMARELSCKGVKEIDGDIIGDDSFFDQERVGKGWKSTYGSASYSAKISALSLNQNTIRVWVSPSKSGSPGIVSLDPPCQNFRVSNQSVTSGRSSYLYISRQAVNSDEDEITVKGNVALTSSGECESISISNPTIYVAGVFYEILKREGITVRGSAKEGRINGNTWQLVQSDSKPLSSIISDFNKHSINFIGELLLKYLGAHFEGVPGTADKGISVVKNKFLIPKVKTSVEGMVMADGSGLSPLNRITPTQFVDVLKYMYNNFEISTDFISSLSIGGADGTLAKRFRRTSAERKIRAKTGSIAGVSSLSGYAMTKYNEPIAFSIIMNNFSNYSIARSIQDKISVFLTGFKN